MDNGHPAGLALARWPRPQGPMAVALPLAFVALSLTLWNLSDLLPLTLWGRGTFAPELADFRQMVFHHARLPRLAMALLAGGALGLSGILYQLVLRNPLAEPTTLGVSAGAQLALGAAMVTAPGLLAEGREGVALGGGLVSALLVFGLSLGRGMAPLTLILAGMIVGYYASTIGSVLVLFNHGTLSELFVWQSGVLSQTGWLDATRLAPRLLLAGGIAALMIRPLTLLGLDEAGARGLGLGLGKTRLAGLAVATALAAVVVAPVGVIGFVGLAAPSVARLSGARLVSQRLVWSTGFGALLLWITDQSVLAAGRFGPEIPTGVATAALGAPFLLWLMRRVRSGTVEGRSERAVGALSRPGLGLVVLLGLLVLVVWGALSLGRGAGGWSWAVGSDFQALLPWRWPRVLGTLAAGAGLALSGLLLRRMTGNPLASPEVLGVGSGAALGVVLLVALVPVFDGPALFAAATLGAGTTLATVLLIARGSGFHPDRLLLAGVVLGAFLSAFVAHMMIVGAPRLGLLMRWLTGSTYRLDGDTALGMLGVTAFLIVCSLATVRWVAIMPLGDAVGGGLGVSPSGVRRVLVLLAAALAAVATLTVGPMSFVGLMAPHMSRLMGFTRPLTQGASAMMLGGIVMVGADFAGRMVFFPWEIPAGLMATLVGGPYLLWLLRR